MNEKNTAQTQKEEREEVLKEIRQLETPDGDPAA